MLTLLIYYVGYRHGTSESEVLQLGTRGRSSKCIFVMTVPSTNRNATRQDNGAYPCRLSGLYIDCRYSFFQTVAWLFP